MDARIAATRVIVQITQHGRSMTAVTPSVFEGIEDPRERRLAQQLIYGVLRWFFQLDAILTPLLRRPLRQRDSDIHALLLIGLYQLNHLRTPDHAAVSTTVDTARSLGKPWASALINGILRTYLRDRERLLDAARRSAPGWSAHPNWLIEDLRHAWPSDWQTILEENNRQAPMTLRVNRREIERDDYLTMLAKDGLEGTPVDHCAQAIQLSKPIDVESLPGFDSGLVSVQDAAAQLAAPLLDPAPGNRVLDACAAPGGKTSHILELQPALRSVVAVERDSRRIPRLRDNLARLRLDAQVIHGDAVADDWWDGLAFDRILIDAPCSGTGIIRRHPDIKLLRHASDIEPQVCEQQRLLDTLWTRLVPGGRLIYATCSILPEENHEQIRRFVARQNDAQLNQISAEWGRDTGWGRQILPGESQMDGFFYASLTKT